jgi:2Fe-2S ferredoxin
MPSVKFVGQDEDVRELAGDAGDTVMRIAVDGGIAGIDGECGGSLSCATCHVHIDAAWVDRVGPPSDYEAGMLESTDSVQDNSRLSCQIIFSDALDGLVVHVPA